MAAEESAPHPAAVAAVAHGKLVQSAEVMKGSTVQMADSADRRTELAADRTVLASERTYAAWMRTGLAALAAGASARAVLGHTVPAWLTKPAASALIAFSGFCFVVAVWRDLTTKAAPPVPQVKRVPPAVLLAVSAVMLIVATAALIGVWEGGRSGAPRSIFAPEQSSGDAS